MSQRPHNLDDLVRATGFSKRQIRFYITKKLVPGAGENRGPNAAYPDEALARLQRIAELKARRLPPTGRRLSLEEIRHELEVAEPQAMAPRMESPRVAEPTVARSQSRPLFWGDQYSDHLMSPPPALALPAEDGPDAVREDATFASPRGDSPAVITPTGGSPAGAAAGDFDLVSLLRRLGERLAELSLEQPGLAASGGAPWHRLAVGSAPDLEIHIRQPQDPQARGRLALLGRSLRELLEPEAER